MELHLHKQETSGMIILCERGDLELIKYYLPIYLTHNKAADPRSSLNSIINPNFCFNKPILKTPARIACANGNTEILDFFLEYFKNQEMPEDFNCDTVDERLLENCAFIACRQGDLNMVKYLHRVWKTDFHLFNIRMDNCINAVAGGCKSYEYESFIECVEFLVKEVGLDAKYRLSESLARA